MKSGRKRNLVLFVLICFAAVQLTGCGSRLSDKFDEAEVETAAQEMVKQVSKGDVETPYNETFAPVMQQGISLEQLQMNLDYILERVGEYDSIQKVAVAGSEDKDTQQPYAVAVVLAKYAEGKVQYTISFDTKMKCIGFYAK